MIKGYPQDLIAWLLDADPDKRYELKEVKKKRTLTQNAYYWELLNKLSRRVGVPDSEVHLNILKDYGVCEVVSFAPHVPKDAIRDYLGDYYDELESPDGRQEFKVYKGSSRMSSLEFKRLLDGLIDECIEQGIETLTPEEISRLKG